MRQLNIGICFYPTTVGLVDDNKPYMEKLFFRLVGEEQIACLAYDNPNKALDFITNQYKADSFINRCLFNQDANEFNSLVSKLDIPAIHKEIYNINRYSEMSVLVIDYAMPEMNGLELSRLIRDSNPYIKLILLTGEAGQNLAVEAFNEGIIDKFILKNAPDVTSLLIQAIRNFQLDYFLNISKTALNKMADFSKFTLPCLSDPVFVEFFKLLCLDKKLIEYYLMDVYGSFLLLDEKGKPSILAVADEELMKTYQSFIKDDHAPASVIDILNTRQMIPYFYSEDDFKVRPSQWEPYLHPARILQCQQTYCCAYIDDISRYDLGVEKIKPYQNFLTTIQGRVPLTIY